MPRDACRPNTCSLHPTHSLHPHTHPADVGGFHKAYELSNYALAGEARVAGWTATRCSAVVTRACSP
jgi:hypothetical protein